MVTKPPVTRGSASRAVEDGGFVRQHVPVGAVEPEPIRRLSYLRDRASATLRIIRSNPTGRIALKMFIGIAGAIVVAIGLALVPLPGPGWALVILGLAIWAVEFAWAKHLLRFTRAQVKGWTDWVKRRSWPVRLLLGLVGMVFIGTVLLLSLKYSFGIDVVADVWDYVTTH